MGFIIAKGIPLKTHWRYENYQCMYCVRLAEGGFKWRHAEGKLDGTLDDILQRTCEAFMMLRAWKMSQEVA